MKLSVCILTSGRFSVFQTCFLSTLVALPEDSEVLVIVNGTHPQTTSWLAKNADPRVSVFEVPKEPRTRSRNRAFKLSRGEFVYFLDDDVVVPAHLFRVVLNVFKRNPHLTAVGGPNLTPLESTLFEKAAGSVMASPFAAPMVCRRYGAGKTDQVIEVDSRHLILCNLALRLKDIPEDIRFREELSSNEENLFLHHCFKRGLKMGFASDAYVYHRRRKTMKTFLSQIFSYGKGRGEQTRLSPRSCHFLFLVPSFTLLTLPFLGYWGASWMSFFVTLYAFLALSGTVSQSVIRSQGVANLILATVFTPFIHIAYGIGFLFGYSAFHWNRTEESVKLDFANAGVSALLLFLFFSVAGPAAKYPAPECSQLGESWKTLSTELKVAKELKLLEANCEGKASQLAYGAHQLKTYLPEMYQFVASHALAIQYGGPGKEHTLAEAEAETGIITLYDALLETGREYIAAQLAHEAAHLRKGGVDSDHVTCTHGALKGDEGACAEKFTGKLEGDSYNFTYVVLEKFFKLAETHPDIDREAVLDEIQQLVQNSFNQIPQEIVDYWMKQPRLDPGLHVPIPKDGKPQP